MASGAPHRGGAADRGPRHIQCHWAAQVPCLWEGSVGGWGWKAGMEGLSGEQTQLEQRPLCPLFSNYEINVHMLS